jgi:hypothetical protein
MIVEDLKFSSISVVAGLYDFGRGNQCRAALSGCKEIRRFVVG